MNFKTKYFFMTTDQAPADVIAEWLRDPLFAAYVKRERAKS